MSLMCRENNRGPETVPSGTPDTTGAQSDLTPFTTTLLPETQESIYPFHSFSSNSIAKQFAFEKFMRGVSKAFSKSNIKVSTWPWLSKIFAQLSITVISCFCPLINLFILNFGHKLQFWLVGMVVNLLAFLRDFHSERRTAQIIGNLPLPRQAKEETCVRPGR